MWISDLTSLCAFELDELFWFANRKEKTETRENMYIMTMISRRPRQFVGFDVDNYRSLAHFQGIVDSAPPAENYYTDGYGGYMEVIFPGRHKRNISDKKDTHIIESTNADLRHYIPGLRRRSRCFYRSIETLKAVLSVFINAYNKFGEAKQLFIQKFPSAKQINFSILNYL